MVLRKGGRRLCSRPLPSVAGDEAFVRTLHGALTECPVRGFSDDGRRHAHIRQSRRRLASETRKCAVPQNLAAIIDHYVAKLGNEERACSPRRPCAASNSESIRSRISLSAMPRSCEMCDQLVREQLWLTAPRPRTKQCARAPYSFRHALFRQVLYERTSAAVPRSSIARSALRSNATVRQVDRSRYRAGAHFERCGVLMTRCAITLKPLSRLCFALAHRRR